MAYFTSKETVLGPDDKTDMYTLTQNLLCHKDPNLTNECSSRPSHFSATQAGWIVTATWLLFCFFNLDQSLTILWSAEWSCSLFIPTGLHFFTIHQSYEWSFILPPSAGKPISLAHLAHSTMHDCVLSWDSLSTAWLISTVCCRCTRHLRVRPLINHHVNPGVCMRTCVCVCVCII